MSEYISELVFLNYFNDAHGRSVSEVWGGTKQKVWTCGGRNKKKYGRKFKYGHAHAESLKLKDSYLVHTMAKT